MQSVTLAETPLPAQLVGACRPTVTKRVTEIGSYEVAIGQSGYADQGKPKALGETVGFVKIVSNMKTDEILGCHIVEENGADIVYEVVIAMELLIIIVGEAKTL